MRASFITLILSLAVAQLNAQVGYRAPAATGEKPLVKYDSTYDFDYVPVNIDPTSMIGQQLYFPAGFKSKEYNSNCNLYVEKKEAVSAAEEKEKGKGFRLKTQVAPAAPAKKTRDYSDVYKPDVANGRPERTCRDSLGNKIFTIAAFKIEKVKNLYGEYYQYTFLLRDDAGQTIYYKLKKESERASFKGLDDEGHTYYVMPFYMVGYLQKNKEQYVGKAYYKKNDLSIHVYNYLTKKVDEIDNRKKYIGAEYTFIDATANHAVPGIILKDEAGKEFATVASGTSSWTNQDKDIYISSNNPGDIGYFWTEKEYQEVLEQEKKEAEKKAAEAAVQRKADSIQRKQDAAFRSNVTKKYGAAVANKILEGKVDLGMTQEMCKIAWGTPSSVSKNMIGSTIVETWHYEWGTYLSFKNGKLTGFAE